MTITSTSVDKNPLEVGVTIIVNKRAQYATGEDWRNNSRKNEDTEPKQKQCPAVEVTGDGSKVQCFKE